jgi:hypothetical protein
MSDIYCRFCAEPWEHDTLHEFNDYPQRGKLFALYGCNALMGDGESREPCATPCIDERVAEASAFCRMIRRTPKSGAAFTISLR